jgi:hypothetical protein
MPFRCKECKFYWDWEVAVPHACPECHAVTAFEKCFPEPRQRGRLATPDDFKCPYCRKTYKEHGIRLHARGVCRDCFVKLDGLELLLPSTQRKRKLLEKTSRPQAIPQESIPKHTEPWMCPDCGSQWPPDVELCRVCNPFCQGCQTYKKLFRGSLCVECYNKAHPQEDSKLEKQPGSVALTPPPMAIPVSANASNSKAAEVLGPRVIKKIKRKEEVSNHTHRVCPSCGLVAEPHEISCSSCGALIEEDHIARFIAKQGNRKISRQQLIRELEKIGQLIPSESLDSLTNLVIALYFKYDLAYPDADKDLQSLQVCLTPFQVDALTELVEVQRRFRDRSEAIQAAVRDLIFKESTIHYLKRSKRIDFS